MSKDVLAADRTTGPHSTPGGTKQVESGPASLPATASPRAGSVLAAAYQLLTAVVFGQKRSHAQLGDALVTFLKALGPIYVKVGQILSTRSDLLPQVIAEKLSGLQDDCDACDFSYVLTKIQLAAGGSVEKVFARIEPEPIACGSVAQVHRAWLKDGGKLVAVKVIKKGAARAVRRDLWLIGGALRLLTRFSAVIRRYQVVDHFTEMARLLREQVDLEREAGRLLEIGQRLEGHPFVWIPKSIPTCSSTDVLTMSFATGVRSTEIDTLGVDRAVLASRFQHAVYTMLYSHGLYHADPHPGNLFFGADGQIQFVDFGLVGELNEDEKWHLSSFYFACTRGDWDRAVERFVRCFVANPEQITPSYAQFKQQFIPVLQRHLHQRTGRWSTVEFLKDAQDVLRSFGSRFSNRFSQVVLTFVTAEGFLTQLDPDIDIWKNARQYTDRASPYMSRDVQERFDREFDETQPGSRALQKRAASCLVAPTHLDRYFFPSQYPLFVKKAEGCRFEDVDGNSYVDLSSGYGPHILGYGADVVRTAFQTVARDGAVNAIGNLAEIELAGLVKEALNCERVVLSNSGTEAVIQAIRLCRLATGRMRVAKFEGHYHGFSDQGLVSSWFRFSGPPEAPLPYSTPGVHPRTTMETLVLPFGRQEALEQIQREAKELACVICEPFSAALAATDRQFLRQVRALCADLGIPLVFDEVVSGFRVGWGGMQGELRIAPDLTVLGKIIGGGLPCGAVAGRAELVEGCKSTGDPFVDCESKAFLGGTMSGNSASCTVGVAVLTYLRDHPQVYTHLDAMTTRLKEGLASAARAQGVSYFVRGHRSIFSMTFAHRNSLSVREQHASSDYKANISLAYYMRRHGVYMPELHTMLLNAAHDPAAIDCVVQAFDLSLREMKQDGFFVY
jgi:glutamate-1-semialdehyde 2,1-aminomutase